MLYTNGSLNCPTYEKGTKGKYQLVVSDKSRNKLKQKLNDITRKTTPASIAERIAKLKEVGRGWLNYFRTAVYKVNSEASTVGFVTGCAIVYGTTGRSLNVNAKI